jgi:antitoxin MazE
MLTARVAIVEDIHHGMYILGVEMQVAKWGNSLAVRLPAAVVEALDLKPGDNVDIHVQGERAFAIEKSPGARELLARLRKYRGRLPVDFKFDRLDANERG